MRHKKESRSIGWNTDKESESFVFQPNTGTPEVETDVGVVSTLLPSCNAAQGPVSELQKGKTTPMTQARVLPSKLHFIKRSKLKKEFIREILDDYKKPTTYDNVTYTPDAKEVKRYTYDLLKLSLEELNMINKIDEFDYELDFMDRLKSLDKKKHAAVTIINDNGTMETGVTHVYSRTFSKDGMTYIVKSEASLKDTEIGMVHFHYYANQPFPIIFKKNSLPEGMPDAKLLDNTIEFKTIEALAQIDIDAKVNLVLVFVIINMVVSAAALLVSLRGFKLI